MLGRKDPQGRFFDHYVYENHLPQDHELIRIHQELDFSFVEAETRDLYEEDWGRPSWPLEALFRMLFLEYYSNLSDVQVSEQCVYNLLYRWFVGLKVGEVTPDDTTLVVFRKRLGRERVEHGAVVADALYDSSENRKAIHEEKTAEGESVKAYIPSRQKEKNLDRFRYEMKGDRVICPAKQVSIGKSPMSKDIFTTSRWNRAGTVLIRRIVHPSMRDGYGSL